MSSAIVQCSRLVVSPSTLSLASRHTIVNLKKSVSFKTAFPVSCTFRVRSMSTDLNVGAEEEGELEFWTRIQQHQKEVPRLLPAEESRTVVNRSTRGILSTHSKKFEGYPFGSMVGFASDSNGRPVLAISSLSPHTGDLEEDPKCSLLVSRDTNQPSESVVVIIGDAKNVPASEVAGVRDAYLKKHPDAFWVDFGDFRFVRIEPSRVRITANVATMAVGATVSEFSAEEYLSSSADPISEFEGPIANHMNQDHENATIAMVEHYLQVKVPSAKILNVDRYGFKVEVLLRGELSRIRLPFPRPANDRKDVKDLIVQMTKEANSK